MNTQREDDGPEVIPEEQLRVYCRVIQELRDSHIPFALGGAFCTAHYTGRWRNTKDIDFYILPRDLEAAVAAITRAGLEDYFPEKPYDRGWIYRAHSGESIVDVIWAMANRRADVDELWICGGPEMMLCGERLRVVPAEEMIWDKLYILQRDRCDWPDCLNLIYTTAANLDWRRLLERVAEDAPLLGGILSVFAWLSAKRARDVPDWVWDQLKISRPGVSLEEHGCRASLLDTRPWYGSKIGKPEPAEC